MLSNWTLIGIGVALFAFAHAWFIFCCLVVAKRSDEAAHRITAERFK